MLSKFIHPLKAFLDISVTLSGMLIDFNKLHFSKLLLIFFRVEGKEIFSIELQFPNAYPPMFSMPSNIMTVLMVFFEEKAKEDSNIQTFQIDEEAFLYLNFNETPQPSLRELEKMVKEIQVAEVNEEEEEKETDQQPDMLQDREQWDLSGDIIDCFRRYSSELSPEEQEEIIKGIEEGMTD